MIAIASPDSPRRILIKTTDQMLCWNRSKKSPRNLLNHEQTQEIFPLRFLKINLQTFSCFETIYRCLRVRVNRGCVQGALSCLACFFACVFTRKGWRKVTRQTEFKQTLDHSPSVFIHNKNGSTENACEHSDYSHEPC